MIVPTRRLKHFAVLIMVTYSSRAMISEDSGTSSSTFLAGSGSSSLNRDYARARVTPLMSSGFNRISRMITSTIRLLMVN